MEKQLNYPYEIDSKIVNDKPACDLLIVTLKLDKDKQVDSLVKKLEMREGYPRRGDNVFDFYYNWKLIGRVAYTIVWKQVYLDRLIASNSLFDKDFLNSYRVNLFSEEIKQLDKVKIPFLWTAVLMKFIKFLKTKAQAYEILLTENWGKKLEDFYNNAFNFLKNKGIIIDGDLKKGVWKIILK